METDPADLIVTNARVTTLADLGAEAAAFAIRDGRFIAVGDDRDVQMHRSGQTRTIDAGGRRVIPGLNDSHIHVIRGGLNYHLELRWDGVPSLTDALDMLREQARRTPAPQWVRVVGGWSPFQFAERRMPTLAEINSAAPDTPVFVLHLYDRAWLNGAALRAAGYTKDTPDPPAAAIERDRHGNPTGLLIARPNAAILYSTLAKGPKLSADDQLNSTRHFMRELNRLGVTSIIDAGGGFQNYPEDYATIDRLHESGQLTLRIAYNLFTQQPEHEFEDFSRWTSTTSPYDGDATYRLNGAGEMLAYSAADFEDFLQPRPELAPRMECDLERIVRHLAGHGWPFRLHATYDESIARFLDVFERVHRDIPLDRLRWFFDHAETITPRNIERVKALGGGIAVQHRMAYQGEYFVDRYGAAAASNTPPVRRMLETGLPVGLGTDATRVASYNPWIALSWLVNGTTVGGLRLYPEGNCLDRLEALRLYTHGSAWMSREDDVKGRIAPGQYADFAILSADYLRVADDEIRSIVSVLTAVDGHIVYAADDFGSLSPPLPPASPGWTPVNQYGGYAPTTPAVRVTAPHRCAEGAHTRTGRTSGRVADDMQSLWGAWGCGCWAY
jgi:predicted amidohydrolase YtcJ